MNDGYRACNLKACNRQMKATVKILGLPFVNCQMPKEHKGRCASAVWHCDICDKPQRGQPAIRNENQIVCFMCYRGLR